MFSKPKVLQCSGVFAFSNNRRKNSNNTKSLIYIGFFVLLLLKLIIFIYIVHLFLDVLKYREYVRQSTAGADKRCTCWVAQSNSEIQKSGFLETAKNNRTIQNIPL